MSAAIPSHAFEQYTIAFYNLENFFDVINDPNILDDDTNDDYTSLPVKDTTTNKGAIFLDESSNDRDGIDTSESNQDICTPLWTSVGKLPNSSRVPFGPVPRLTLITTSCRADMTHQKSR